jgi:hypothetical protein
MRSLKRRVTSAKAKKDAKKGQAARAAISNSSRMLR